MCGTDAGIKSKGGEYTITAEMKAGLSDFYGNYCSRRRNEQKRSRRIFEDADYVIDPHTAVAAGVYKKYTDGHQGYDSDSDRIHSKPIQIHKKCYGCNL